MKGSACHASSVISEGNILYEKDTALTGGKQYVRQHRPGSRKTLGGVVFL